MRVNLEMVWIDNRSYSTRTQLVTTFKNHCMTHYVFSDCRL